MEKSTKKIKFGIYGIGLLMMGVIGISSSLATIGAHFPDASQTMIQNLISISCIVIIPTTIVVGKLMQTISKKTIVMVGIALFLIGGVAPAFISSLTVIMVMRAVLGIGVGICQVVSTAIAVEHFSGAEQEKVQGTLQSSQMLGTAIMVFVGGRLAMIAWNYAFYVHLIAVLSFILVAVMIPNTKPEKIKKTGVVQKAKFTAETWGWIVFMFLLFIGFQIYNISLSYLIAQRNLGTAADAGLGIAFFAIGGFVMGLLYGKLVKITKNCTTAIGCFLLVGSYVLIVYANNLVICYLGCVLFGMAIATTLPGVFINTAKSVDAFSAGMAISVVTCAQNFGQFICPFIINPISAFVSGSNDVSTGFFIGAFLATILTVVMMVWGIKKNKQSAIQVV